MASFLKTLGPAKYILYYLPDFCSNILFSLVTLFTSLTKSDSVNCIVFFIFYFFYKYSIIVFFFVYLHSTKHNTNEIKIKKRKANLGI